MNASDRLLRYVTWDTTSDENASEDRCPSSSGQLPFAKALAEEMKGLGLMDVRVDENGYVYGSLPAKDTQGAPVLGFISHMDTSSSASGAGIHARVVHYEGGDIVLNPERQIVMRAADFESLRDYVGRDLIVTDGTTLLGADDKAGIAEILTAVERIRQFGMPHGELRIAFTPDEEIGRGADRFDVKGFGADFAYTVDGGKLGEIEYENFNAASADVTIHGFNIHPGSAKNKMKNASLMAMEFDRMLPRHELPSCTDGYEGFHHLTGMQGCEEEASLHYIIRDHDREKFEAKKRRFEAVAAYLNGLWGAGTVELRLRDSYYNMREKIEPHMFLIDRAAEAMKHVGATPRIQPIRGGTDGARLSYMGLPCPNLSTGGHNFHGRFEYIPVASMEKMADMLTYLAGLFRVGR